MITQGVDAVLSKVSVWWHGRRRRDHSNDRPVSEKKVEIQLGQLKRFSLEELQIATNNFSVENSMKVFPFREKLRECEDLPKNPFLQAVQAVIHLFRNINVMRNKRFIPRGYYEDLLYKGRLVDGSLVIIKRFRKDRAAIRIKLQTEVDISIMGGHQNLQQVLGYCMTRTEQSVVYPYMTNGTVGSWLRDRLPSQPPLDWPTRERIALGCARALSFLHEHFNPKVIHGDVKSENIFLNDEFEPVLGDFGWAILLDPKANYVETVVRGTIGHLPPEYALLGKSSEKTDVFGYGMMLLELITGQRVLNLALLADDHDVMLLEWVKEVFKEKKFEKLVDRELQNNYVEEEVESLIQIALLCSQDTPDHRPKMSDVVRMIRGNGLAQRWEKYQRMELIKKVVEPESPHHRYNDLSASFSNSDEELELAESESLFKRGCFAFACKK